MKKYILLLAFACMILAGCNVEEKTHVANSDPDDLFIGAQSLFKEKIPAAKFEVNISERKLIANVGNNVDYPPYIELSFKKDAGGTMVIITAPDDDQRKLKNLYHLLQTNYHLMNKQKRIEQRIQDTIHQNREEPPVMGVPDRNQKGSMIDRNNDGRIDPAERRMWQNR
ncbi:MAG: hypothetical protein ABIH39_05335 [Candidatus Margulisiibacteriota bacterium]